MIECKLLYLLLFDLNKIIDLLNSYTMERVMNTYQPTTNNRMSYPMQEVSKLPIPDLGTALYEVGTALGLRDKQAVLFAQEVLYKAMHNSFNAKGKWPLRIRLIQMMVYKCLFHISSELLMHSFKNVSSDTFYIPQMPLSYWAVYILHHTIGLSKNEIAFILNTSVLQVNKRLNKALEYIYSH